MRTATSEAGAEVLDVNLGSSGFNLNNGALNTIHEKIDGHIDEAFPVVRAKVTSSMGAFALSRSPRFRRLLRCVFEFRKLHEPVLTTGRKDYLVTKLQAGVRNDY